MSSKFDFGKKKVVSEKELLAEKLDNPIEVYRDVSAPLDAEVDYEVEEKRVIEQYRDKEKGGEGVTLSHESPQVSLVSASSPSNVVQRVGIGESLGKLFGGGKATNDSNIQRLAVKDENLVMVTNTVDPLVQTLVDVLAMDAEAEGLRDVADTYKHFSDVLDGRMASHNGWRANQLEKIYTKRHEEEVGNPELQEKVEGLGKRGR